MISGLHAQPLVVLERSGALQRLGADSLFEDFADAVAHARVLLAKTP